MATVDMPLRSQRQVLERYHEFPRKVRFSRSQTSPLPEFDHVTAEFFWQLRWRKPKRDRERVLTGILVVIALHLLFFLLLRSAMRPRSAEETRDIVRVELIQDADLSSAKAEPALAVQSSLPSPNILPNHSLSVSNAITYQPEKSSIPNVVKDTPELRLFNLDGSLNIPKDFLQQIEHEASTSKYSSRQITTSPIMRHKHLLPYQATLFEPYWVPRDETLGGELMRRYAKRQGTFKTPWGGRIECISVLLVITTCRGVPPPAWQPPTRWHPVVNDEEE